MVNCLLAVMMIPKEKHRRGEEKNRKERIRKKEGGKLLRQLETGREERGGERGVWHIDRPACVHLSPEDKT